MKAEGLLDAGSVAARVRRGSPAVLPTRQGYDRWAATYDSDGNPLVALEKPVIKALLGRVRGLRVADIGCGTGRHALALAREGADVTAVDFSRSMLQVARSKAGSGKVRFRLHDVRRPLPFRDSMFDRVLCGLVLEHLRDLDSFFRELGRVCRKDGYIVISAMHPAMWLKGQSARFFDPASGGEVRPRSYPQRISDYVMAIVRSGLVIDSMSEHAPGPGLARRFPRAAKHIGWPMLLALRLRRSDSPAAPGRRCVRRHSALGGQTVAWPERLLS